ncbi:hypothetical protein G7Y79_00025g057430 [Physcia stellaris]|nr:hypothetical protein G7Y79_00025g057430 [Physcia stellaris]
MAPTVNKEALIRSMKRQTKTYTKITAAIVRLRRECSDNAIDEYNNEPSLDTRFGRVRKPFVKRLFEVNPFIDKCDHLDFDPENDSDWNLLREGDDVQTLIEEEQKGQRNCDDVEHQLEVTRNATRWWRVKLAAFKKGR